MSFKRYIVVLMSAVAIVMACRDESLYPLPYDNRTTGHYLRIYNISSNIWNREDLANSAFEAVYESVDAQKGDFLESVTFYATFRRGSAFTREVEVRTVTFNDFGFAPVPPPTFSEYKRSAPFRITANEVRNALQSDASTDPDGPGPLIAYPADAGLLGDIFIIRWKATTKDGQSYTVFNPQSTINPAFGNMAEANMTPNVTRGQFYNAPYIISIPVSETVTNAVTDPDPYIGQYRMTQVAIWSPSHSTALHLTNMPRYMIKPFLFHGNPSTDSTQIVDLQRPANGLPSEREFTCFYRGEQITLRISLEAGQNTVNADALATLTTATNVDVFPALHAAKGLGFPPGTTTTNLGTVFVKLQNTTVNCNERREFYQVTPPSGVFNPRVGTHPITGATISPPSALPLPWGCPRSTFPNRGVYRIDRDGKSTAPGNVDVFTIGIDDDVDEYGRRNGYCSWYRRVYLRLEKI